MNLNETNLKKYFWLLINVFLAVAIVATLAGVAAAKKYKESFYPTRTISATAEGKATVTPDVAETSFAIVSQGRDPQALAQENNEKMAGVIAEIKRHGIEQKDIKTTGYNLSPDYQYDENTRRNFISGYTLNQTVSVKIRDLSKVAPLLSAMTPLGVNQIGGVNFTIDDPEKFLAEARGEAIEKAREKARTIAAQSGVRLGKVVNVSEFQGGPVYPYFKAEASMGRGGMDMAQNAPAVPMPAIEPGSQEVTVSVAITYSLR